MKPKVTFHPELFSLIFGVRWKPKQRTLYVSIPFLVVRIHLWKPSNWKSKLTVYRVSEDGCVTHTVVGVSDDDAIDRTKRHLTERVGMSEDDIGEMWVEHRYEDDEVFSIQLDGGPCISHTAKEWAHLDNDRYGYLACSEF
tara:strand:+ start:259 stop:681 length:423 start_codon:yes stop_codon:yes gene_type:complete